MALGAELFYRRLRVVLVPCESQSENRKRRKTLGLASPGERPIHVTAIAIHNPNSPFRQAHGATNPSFASNLFSFSATRFIPYSGGPAKYCGPYTSRKLSPQPQHEKIPPALYPSTNPLRGPRSPKPHTQTFTIDDLGLGGGAADSGTYNQNDTFSFDVYLTSLATDCYSYDLNLETQTLNNFAASLFVTGLTYGPTFTDPSKRRQTPPPLVLPRAPLPAIWRGSCLRRAHAR